MNDVRLLILGDSITAGCVETGVPPQNSYPSLLRDAFNRESLDVTVIVSALHGVYVDYVLRRFDRMVLRHQPDNVLIFLGANDAGATETRPAISPDQFAADLVSLVSRCRENDISPVIASPIPCAMDRCLHPMNQYADASRDTARRCKAGFVDLFNAFDRSGGLALLPDGLHPNPHGNTVIARTLATALSPQIVRSECNVL
ncbi:MAG: SGNH/GDSL hydrolase family protein [Planctomycetales bacterium]|jgi:acyl-CoA thioesterase I